MDRDAFFTKYGVTLEPHSTLRGYFVVKAEGLETITAQDGFTNVLACPNYGRVNPNHDITAEDHETALETLKSLAMANKLYAPDPEKPAIRIALSPTDFS